MHNAQSSPFFLAFFFSLLALLSAIALRVIGYIIAKHER